MQANDTCILTLVSGVTYFERDTGLGMVVVGCWGGRLAFFWIMSIIMSIMSVNCWVLLDTVFPCCAAVATQICWYKRLRQGRSESLREQAKVQPLT